MPAAVDWKTVRENIALVIEQVDPILKVNRYEKRREIKLNMPYASIYLEVIEGPDAPRQGQEADLELGVFDHLATWTIRVYSPWRDDEQAQQEFETLAPLVRQAFDGSMLIGPQSSEPVDYSRVPLIEHEIRRDANQNPTHSIVRATLRTIVRKS